MPITPNPVTFSEDTSTETLLKLWKNVKRGLDRVAREIDNGTFNTPAATKGAAPPSQAGQLTLWLAMGIDIELTRRGVKH